MNPYAKFRFPSKDPEPSNIIDERFPPQILDDILRLSSQILNPAETELWSSICERDLRKVTKNQYLSGIRKIASGKKNEIAEFWTSNTQKKALSDKISNIEKIPKLTNLSQFAQSSDKNPNSLPTINPMSNQQETSELDLCQEIDAQAMKTDLDLASKTSKPFAKADLDLASRLTAPFAKSCPDRKVRLGTSAAGGYNWTYFYFWSIKLGT